MGVGRCSLNVYITRTGYNPNVPLVQKVLDIFDVSQKEAAQEASWIARSRRA